VLFRLRTEKLLARLGIKLISLYFSSQSGALTSQQLPPSTSIGDKKKNYNMLSFKKYSPFIEFKAQIVFVRKLFVS